MSTDRIRALIEASSLGTPEAKAARESVSDEAVARCLARAKAYRAEMEAGDDAARRDSRTPRRDA